MLECTVRHGSSSYLNRFDKGITIIALKDRLEIITGCPVAFMELAIENAQGCISPIESDNRSLGFYASVSHPIIHVTNANPYSKSKTDFSDTSLVKKFELTEEEYNSRQDSLKAWMLRNQVKKMAPEESLEGLQLGQRVAVTIDGFSKKGSIRFLGNTKFKPGNLVGVEYDEPLGKHDGTRKHGAFVSPSSVTVLSGEDAKEEDPFDDLCEI